jgi:ABC-2 type transport system ATP-binding protein
VFAPSPRGAGRGLERGSLLIRIEGLSKTYGRARDPALDGVSFGVARGEIVGLLGPNGAGKSTLMRILACFLAPTRGTAELDGHSIAGDTRAVRRSLGYLPEAVPLPPEMRVGEYLGFRAALKGVPRGRRRAAIDDAIGAAGLGDRGAQIIGTLSRGYRQRVGLADALLGRPPILILDEPTVGLDPNQIRETRELIRRLGQEHAVLLSTHVLSEVEAIAGRVVILNRGRLVAAETPAALRARMQARRRLVIEVRDADRERAEHIYRGLPGVTAVDAIDGTHLALSLAAGDDGAAREAVFQAAVTDNLVLRELRSEEPSLEDLFAQVTS